MPPSKSSGQTARARRREDFWNRVTFLVGCASVVGIIASIVAVGSQQIMRSSPVVAETGVRSNEPPGAPKAVPLAAGIEDIESRREKISQTVEGLIGARSVEAKLPFVRDPHRVKALMEEYYAREPMPNLKWRGLGRLVRVDEPGYRFGYVQALFENASSITLIIEEMDDGSFRVDWECLVRYGELAWQDFLRLRPVEPKLLRVKATRAAAPDSKVVAGTEWLELRHPEQPGVVLASFVREDPRFAALLAQLDQGRWKDVPLTLRLAFLGGEGNQVAITGVEGKGWLILGSHTY